jgi:hypothetical protein
VSVLLTLSAVAAFADHDRWHGNYHYNDYSSSTYYGYGHTQATGSPDALWAYFGVTDPGGEFLNGYSDQCSGAGCGSAGAETDRVYWPQGPGYQLRSDHCGEAGDHTFPINDEWKTCPLYFQGTYAVTGTTSS